MKHLLSLIPLVLALSASTTSAQQGPRRGDGAQRGQTQPQQCDCDCHLQGQQQGRGQTQRGQQQGFDQMQRGQRGPSQDGLRGGDQRPSREQMLKDFDLDGDGRLNAEERSAARAVRMYQMRTQRMEESRAGEQRSQQQARRGPQGQQRGQRRLQQGPQQGQQQGQRGPQLDQTQATIRAERHAAILKRFDTDGDGFLNAVERKKVRAEISARRSASKPNARGGASQDPEQL